MKSKMTIVMTTINDPVLLDGYADNFEKYGRLGEVDTLVVGDHKTPHAVVKARCARLTARGFRCEYLDLEAQQKYMERFPEMAPLIPFNSDQRRNVGYLMAMERGVELLAMVDDDNWVRDDDWFLGHSVVGQTVELKTVASASRWYNPCRLMDTDPPGRQLYPRGHPYGRRHLPFDDQLSQSQGRVVVNGGLWLIEADVDSLTRLTEPVRCTRLNEPRIMLARGTWANINTQNTVVHRDTMPAFYYVPLTAQLGGVMIERYGDIWAGLLLRRAIDHLDDRVTYGWPACDHKRNMHVLLKDLQLEFFALLINELLWEKLYDCKLTARTYAGVYLELADHLEAAEWPTLPMSAEVKSYFARMSRAMRTWVSTCKELGFPAG